MKIPREDYAGFYSVCLDLFGEKNAAQVSSFYTEVLLKFGGQSVQSKKRSDHLKKSVDKYGVAIVLESILNLHERYKNHQIKQIPQKYFDTVLENKFTGGIDNSTFTPAPKSFGYTKQNNNKVSTKFVIQPSITPSKNTKNNLNHELEIFNWDYKCECGEVVAGGTKECPVCERSFIWRDYV